jgi:diadenosine tetraphosphate (Ap4A) HIT family hydrolase
MRKRISDISEQVIDLVVQSRKAMNLGKIDEKTWARMMSELTKISKALDRLEKLSRKLKT